MTTIKVPLPYAPPTYTDADVAAIQALQKGEATPDQQQRALEWIVNQAAGTYDLEYRPDSRDHAFCSGRRFVGLQIVKLSKISLAALNRRRDG